MFLKSISLTNYRNFEHYSLEFGKRTTMLIGRNGMGKTNLINSMVQAISFIFSKQRNMPQTDFIRSSDQGVKRFSATDARFRTDPQYPEFCWTELCVNAICHRDYSILGTDIQVKLFDDHMTVESPGILPGLVRPNNIREMHFSRNPKIALYMRNHKLVKEFGEGVDRMLTLSTSVTTRQNSSKLGFVLAAPSVS